MTFARVGISPLTLRLICHTQTYIIVYPTRNALSKSITHTHFYVRKIVVVLCSGNLLSSIRIRIYTLSRHTMRDRCAKKELYRRERLSPLLWCVCVLVLLEECTHTHICSFANVPRAQEQFLYILYIYFYMLGRKPESK